jgi:hypothetical protein
MFRGALGSIHILKPNSWYQVFFPRGLNDKEIMFNTYLHLGLRLGMNGALPLLPLYALMAWRRQASFSIQILNSVIPRRIFEPKRDKVTGEWRRIRNEEHNEQYF